jgi:MFS family permease
MSARSRWTILAEMCLCMVCAAFALQSVSPVLSLIMKEFRLTHHEAGLLVSLFSFPAVLISLPVGMLADRYGIKPVGVIGLLLTLAGTLLIATGTTFGVLLMGRVVAGAGAISLLIIAPQGVAQWFAGKEMGIAMGIFNASGPLGIIGSLVGLSALGSRFGWRAGVWTVAVLVVMTLVVLALFFSSSPLQLARDGEGGRKPWRLRGMGPSIWLVGLAWAFFNGAAVSLFSFAPDFMVGQGLSLALAGFYTSLVMAGSLFLSPITGYAVDRLGRREVFIAVGGTSTAVLLLLVPQTHLSFAPLMLSIGVAFALIPAPVFSLAAETVTRNDLGLGFGVLSMLNNLGVLVCPQLVGLSRDLSGSYRMGFWLMALFALLIGAVALVVPLFARRHKPPAASHGIDEALPDDQKNLTAV